MKRKNKKLLEQIDKCYPSGAVIPQRIREGIAERLKKIKRRR